jgi:hypothetical protein
VAIERAQVNALRCAAGRATHPQEPIAGRDAILDRWREHIGFCGAAMEPRPKIARLITGWRDGVVINDQPTQGLGSTATGGDGGPHCFYVFLRSALDMASFKYAGHGRQGDRTISLPRAAPSLPAALVDLGQQPPPAPQQFRVAFMESCQRDVPKSRLSQ